jgi:rare lipoprotein A
MKIYIFNRIFTSYRSIFRVKTLFLFFIFLFLLTACSTGSVREERTFEALEKEARKGAPEDPIEKEFDETGYVSWYGDQFQNKPTASGEIFDKNKMTAAHRSLPFGSEVKVINLENQKEAVVKINDRGPFNKARIIDVTEKVAELLEFKESGLAKVGIMVLHKGNSKLMKDDDFNLDEDDDEDDDDEPTSTKPPKKEEPRKKGKEVPPAKKPPVTPAPVIKETKEAPVPKEIKDTPPKNNPNPQGVVIEIQPKGFTTQIGVFKEKKRADALKAELKGITTEPIFLFMRGSTFVMQIGDFNTREEAVTLRDKLKLKGYFSFIPPK